MEMTIEKSILTSSYPPSLRTYDRAEMKSYFINSWEIYESLFSSIKEDSTYYESPDPLRNPLIFYYGHTAAFYINKLVLAGLLEKGINTYFEEIFAKGVDPDLPKNLNPLDVWPTMEEVRSYRTQVFEAVVAVIEKVEVSGPVTSKDPVWALHMGLEHDRIHFETSSVLIRQLNVNSVEKPEGWEYAPTLGDPQTNEWIDVDAGVVQLGKKEPSDWFGWDNEYGSATKHVKAFKATKNLVTNAEYMAFVENGYNDDQFWSEKGLEWKRRVGSSHPKFWVPQEDHFTYRAMFDELEMPKDWPVEVNAFEAQAYCKWLNDGSRLMTEAEFNLASRSNDRDEPLLDATSNLNMHFGSPSPVGYLEDSSSSFNDLFGNVWDWLDEDFMPLEGFETHPYYTDFSAPYFGSDHSMMLGGSWSTSGTGASKYYRLWFRHFFYQHAGFRLAKNA